MASEASFTGPVNLGNPGEFSMLALADAVMRETGSVSATVFKPLPQDDPLQRKPDISLARKALDWKPKIELQEGLSRTVEYFRTVVSN